MVQKKRGRPRKTIERRAQIIEAFLRCIDRLGLRESSIGAVAAELDLDRTTLHHYFRSRDELVTAALDRIIERYHAFIESELGQASDPEERISRLIRFDFDTQDPHLFNVMHEFRAVSRHDPKALAKLRQGYQVFIHHIRAVLEKRYPDAPAEEVRRVAYALSQLIEGAYAYAIMGFERDQIDAARKSAVQLVRQLEPRQDLESSKARLAETSKP